MEEGGDTLPLDRIREFFHLSARDACLELNLSQSRLKKICRQHGISRWPHRKLASLEALRIQIQAESGLPPPELQALLARLDAQVAAVKADPDRPLEKEFSNMRATSYKVRYHQKTRLRRERRQASGDDLTPGASSEDDDGDAGGDSDAPSTWHAARGRGRNASRAAVAQRGGRPRGESPRGGRRSKGQRRAPSGRSASAAAAAAASAAGSGIGAGVVAGGGMRAGSFGSTSRSRSFGSSSEHTSGAEGGGGGGGGFDRAFGGLDAGGAPPPQPPAVREAAAAAAAADGPAAQMRDPYSAHRDQGHQDGGNIEQTFLEHTTRQPRARRPPRALRRDLLVAATAPEARDEEAQEDGEALLVSSPNMMGMRRSWGGSGRPFGGGGGGARLSDWETGFPSASLASLPYGPATRGVIGAFGGAPDGTAATPCDAAAAGAAERQGAPPLSPIVTLADGGGGAASIIPRPRANAYGTASYGILRRPSTSGGGAAAGAGAAAAAGEGAAAPGVSLQGRAASIPNSDWWDSAIMAEVLGAEGEGEENESPRKDELDRAATAAAAAAAAGGAADAGGGCGGAGVDPVARAPQGQAQLTSVAAPEGGSPPSAGPASHLRSQRSNPREEEDTAWEPLFSPGTRPELLVRTRSAAAAAAAGSGGAGGAGGGGERSPGGASASPLTPVDRAAVAAAAAAAAAAAVGAAAPPQPPLAAAGAHARSSDTVQPFTDTRQQQQQRQQPEMQARLGRSRLLQEPPQWESGLTWPERSSGSGSGSRPGPGSPFRLSPPFSMPWAAGLNQQQQRQQLQLHSHAPAQSMWVGSSDGGSGRGRAASYSSAPPQSWYDSNIDSQHGSPYGAHQDQGAGPWGELPDPRVASWPTATRPPQPLSPLRPLHPAQARLWARSMPSQPLPQQQQQQQQQQQVVQQQQQHRQWLQQRYPMLSPKERTLIKLNLMSPQNSCFAVEPEPARWWRMSDDTVTPTAATAATATAAGDEGLAEGEAAGGGGTLAAVGSSGGEGSWLRPLSTSSSAVRPSLGAWTPLAGAPTVTGGSAAEGDARAGVAAWGQAAVVGGGGGCGDTSPAALHPRASTGDGAASASTAVGGESICVGFAGFPRRFASYGHSSGSGAEGGGGGGSLASVWGRAAEVAVGQGGRAAAGSTGAATATAPAIPPCLSSLHAVPLGEIRASGLAPAAAAAAASLRAAAWPDGSGDCGGSGGGAVTARAVALATMPSLPAELEELTLTPTPPPHLSQPLRQPLQQPQGQQQHRVRLPASPCAPPFSLAVAGGSAAAGAQAGGGGALSMQGASLPFASLRRHEQCALPDALATPMATWAWPPRLGEQDRLESAAAAAGGVAWARRRSAGSLGEEEAASLEAAADAFLAAHPTPLDASANSAAGGGGGGGGGGGAPGADFVGGRQPATLVAAAAAYGASLRPVGGKRRRDEREELGRGRQDEEQRAAGSRRCA